MLACAHDYVQQESPDFRKCDDLTSTMRSFAIPWSVTRVKRNTMQSGHTIQWRREKRGLLFLCLLVLSRGFCSSSHRIKHLALMKTLIPLKISSHSRLTDTKIYRLLISAPMSYFSYKNTKIDIIILWCWKQWRNVKSNKSIFYPASYKRINIIIIARSRLNKSWVPINKNILMLIAKCQKK